VVAETYAVVCSLVLKYLNIWPTRRNVVVVAENVFLLKSLVRITNALGLSCLGLQHLGELGLVCADSRVDIIIVCPSLLQQSAATPAATPAAAPAAAPGVLGCMICVCLSAADSNFG
jgi:hypothetical protein